MSKVDVKCVLLGKEFGGKTSLVERYVHKRFVEKPSNKYQATIGAAYASKKIDVDQSSIILGIWDTAGSERYEAMSRMYYRNARAAIVCFDLTDANSFERSKFWIEELKANEEKCKIYLCGTKRDLINMEPNARRISEKAVSDYACAIGAKVFETSSKTGENVEELFETVARDYVQFEMQLEGLSRTTDNFIEQENKRKFCCF